MERIQVGGLSVAGVLHDFIEREALPGTGVASDAFWNGLAATGARPRPAQPRTARPARRIARPHRRLPSRAAPASHSTRPATSASCARSAISRPEPEDFSIRTENVDDEIARIAGPQLVVPVSNARYALNAANARWGSLYDALYGTDAIPEDGGAERGRGFNKARGERVVARAKEFLDEAAPLAAGPLRGRGLLRG